MSGTSCITHMLICSSLTLQTFHQCAIIKKILSHKSEIWHVHCNGVFMYVYLVKMSFNKQIEL